MTEPYVGEIRMAGFNFTPQDWLPCDGSTVNITDYEELFALIGTTYGGDGSSTFGLPDLRGRAPIHQGTGGGQTIAMGQAGGSESVTLQAQQVGPHSHSFMTALGSSSQTPGNGTMLGDSGDTGSGAFVYGPTGSLTAMAGQSIGPSTGGQPHENRQPLLCVNFIISPFGQYPSQT